ncbi:MAG: hopanoid biosynthesis-associated protein HpnK [Candidatus Binatus sp.]|uniref:hopanoid biosynthesis-associated protein HpnK n=1 Tax=Candidatus Binatus sp. TaxID=2811406 RepID=UPI00272535B5|nr:hopanoid biosynthesis-associated protein HpnK [Candidatus Binatus sp.]MDO8430846.1 hopanoid biosynthesis-associated protein HpnK [Candidatus Binatus sp.]
MKRLIVNGDDFGRSPEINAGIVRAHREGILGSASLMVAEPAAREAAELAKSNPALDVGLHAVVCRGRSVLNSSRLAGAVGDSGEFIESPVTAGMRYFFDRLLRAKMRDELRAQVERHLELIGYLNHIDGHLNFHVHPLVADILVELAVEYKVPCIRLPRERVMTTLRLRRDHAARKLIESVIFRTLSRRTRRLMAERGLKSTDALFGLHQSGHLSEDYVVGVIEKLRDGATELYFHPAADVGGVPPPAEAQLEVEILTSARVRESIDRRAIKLITFAELGRGEGEE